MIQIDDADLNLPVTQGIRITSAPQSEILKNYLTGKGFQLEENTNSYLFMGNVDAIFLERIIDFLHEFDDDIRPSKSCLHLLDELRQEREDFDRIANEALKIKEVETPPHFPVPRMRNTAQLEPYQRMPVLHAVSAGNSANFSVPGSGKTWMAYSAYFLLQQQNIVNKLLVVGPIASFRPWEIEYEAITGESIDGRILRLTGINSDVRYQKFRAAAQYEIFLLNYEIAGIEAERLKGLLESDKFLMIIDESHHIKTPTAIRTQSIFDLSRKAKRRMILTGTPMPKFLADLWSQFHYLYPDQNLLEEYPVLREISKPDHPDKDAAIQRYGRELSAYFTRVSRTQLQLPDAEFNPTNNGQPHRVEMGPSQRRIYDAIRGRIQIGLENQTRFENDREALEQYVRKAIVYLIEASIDPALIRHDTQFDTNDVDPIGLDGLELLNQYPSLRNEPRAKYNMAVELARESLERGEKVIVWSNFITSINKLGDYFREAGHEPILIYGAVPRDPEKNPRFNRELLIDQFKTTHDHNVLIANPASLAESVSLHKECHHAIYLDRTFNGGHYMQSLERIHRVGLLPGTHTRYDIIESENCIDQDVEIILDRKKRDMDAFFDSSELMVRNLGLGDGDEEEDSIDPLEASGSEIDELHDILRR